MLRRPKKVAPMAIPQLTTIEEEDNEEKPYRGPVLDWSNVPLPEAPIDWFSFRFGFDRKYPHPNGYTGRIVPGIIEARRATIPFIGAKRRSYGRGRLPPWVCPFHRQRRRQGSPRPKEDEPPPSYPVHPQSYPVRPPTSSSVRPGSSASVRPGSSASVRPGSSASVRPSSSSSVRPPTSSSVRPGSSSSLRPPSSPARPGSSSSLRHPTSPVRPGSCSISPRPPQPPIGTQRPKPPRPPGHEEDDKAFALMTTEIHGLIDNMIAESEKDDDIEEFNSLSAEIDGLVKTMAPPLTPPPTPAPPPSLAPPSPPSEPEDSRDVFNILANTVNEFVAQVMLSREKGVRKMYEVFDVMSRGKRDEMVRIIEFLNGDLPGYLHLKDGIPSTIGGPDVPNELAPVGPKTDPIEKWEQMFIEWIHLFSKEGTPTDSTKPFRLFVHDLSHEKIFADDETLTSFLTFCVKLCIKEMYKVAEAASPWKPPDKVKLYYCVDALARLVALLIKHIGAKPKWCPTTRLILLRKFLGILATLLLEEAKNKKTFQQLVFHRMLVMLLQDLIKDPKFNWIQKQFLYEFGYILHILEPSTVPGFVYSWMEIVGNRNFYSLMLQDDHRALAIYYQLIYDLLIFVRPFLRSADLHKQPGTTLYRGTRKLFLQMFHEHVEFLTLFSYHFLTHIPPNCMQLRNIVLSAAPRRIPLPDPFTTSVKFKELKDATGTPQVLLEVGKTLHRIRARAPLMKYLRTREPSDFRSRLLWCLEQKDDDGKRYGAKMINALVVFMGVCHVYVLQDGGKNVRHIAPSKIVKTPFMKIYEYMVLYMKNELRYLFVTALVNQLKFPSAYTHYFYLVILHLFKHVQRKESVVVQECITRVLLERLNKLDDPHPWGLRVLFSELISNGELKFLEQLDSYAPETAALLDHVPDPYMANKYTPVPPLFKYDVDFPELDVEKKQPKKWMK